MRVVVIPEWYPSPEDPVAGTFVRDQARAVACLHDVTVLAPSSVSAPPSEVDDGVRVLRLPAATGSGRLGRLRQLRAMNALIVQLERRGLSPDVLHAHVFSAGALAVLLGRRRTPVVLSEHHTDFVEGLVRGWDAVVARLAFRSAAVVCPVSETLRRSIIELEPRARCEVIGNVVDIDAFASLDRHLRSQSGSRILAIGGLVRQKGIPYLLEALRLLSVTRSDVALEIIGDGPDRPLLENQARGLPVTFLGALPRPAVAERMRAASVVAVSSVVETFGIVAVEALAAGVPVVMTSTGVSDVVAELGGRVVPPADPAALSDALRQILDRPERSGRIDVADDVRRRFGAKAIADAFDDVYRTVTRPR